MPTEATPDVSYLFDNATIEAGRQVRLLADILDPYTEDFLDSLALGPGVTALDLGAGAGTIARFLADDSNIAGVVALDVNTQHIEPAERVTIRQEDVSTADLGDGEYDLIHARLLFMHQPRREALLERAVTALKPGGHLVISDWDCTHLDEMLLSAGPELREAFLAFQNALITGGQQIGMDPAWARRIPAAMHAAGLAEVEAHTYNRLWRGGQPGMQLHASNSRQLEPQLLNAGLTRQQLQILREGMEDPQVTGYSYLMYTAVGRRQQH